MNEIDQNKDEELPDDREIDIANDSALSLILFYRKLCQINYFWSLFYCHDYFVWNFYALTYGNTPIILVVQFGVKCLEESSIFVPITNKRQQKFTWKCFNFTLIVQPTTNAWEQKLLDFYNDLWSLAQLIPTSLAIQWTTPICESIVCGTMAYTYNHSYHIEVSSNDDPDWISAQRYYSPHHPEWNRISFWLL